MSELENWVNVIEAASLTGYSCAYLRWLANQGRLQACKIGRDWLINREGLLAHKDQMETLGDQRHNPWREDLVEDGRGRKGEQ